MFPELTKGHCSWFGAWDEATENGNTIQLRSLDWDVNGPFKNYPALTVYHPDDGNDFVNIGFTGFVGAITGMNDQQMGISEIGITYPDDSFGQGTQDTGPQKVKGTPFIFLLRDTLQFTSSLEDSVNHMTESERTCNLALMVGDGKLDNTQTAGANGIEYSGEVLVNFKDDDLLPVNDTWHYQIEDTVYLGMDWLCPAYSQVLGDQLSKYHSQITPELTIQNILPTIQSGNLHIGLYDLTANHLYVSFCKKDDDSSSLEEDDEPQYAYERPFTKLYGSDLFNEDKPEV